MLFLIKNYLQSTFCSKSVVSFLAQVLLLKRVKIDVKVKTCNTEKKCHVWSLITDDCERNIQSGHKTLVGLPWEFLFLLSYSTKQFGWCLELLSH